MARADREYILRTACAEILPYEFYRVAPEGVTFVTTNLVIRDARGVEPGRGFVAKIRYRRLTGTINCAASAHSDDLKRSEKSTPVE